MLISPEQAEQWLTHGYVVPCALVGMIGLTVGAELLFPIGYARIETAGRTRTNVALGVANFIFDALVPVSAVAIIAWMRARGWGLFPAIGFSGWAAVVVTVVIFSAAQYWLHRWSHEVAWLWRIHRVHHADEMLDITTTFRQHPLNRPLAIVYFSVIGVVLGLAPLGLLIVSVATTLLSVLHHADVRLGSRLDRMVALFVVTPAIHRIHHSTYALETNSNYGDVLTVWDRVFGTWRPSVTDDQRDLRFGLGDRDHARLRAQLLSPFRR